MCGLSSDPWGTEHTKSNESDCASLMTTRNARFDRYGSTHSKAQPLIQNYAYEYTKRIQWFTVSNAAEMSKTPTGTARLESILRIMSSNIFTKAVTVLLNLRFVDYNSSFYYFFCISSTNMMCIKHKHHRNLY